MITVLLVDDQATVRQGLTMRLALEPDLKVVGEACNGVEALQRAQELQPDVVVMDVEMPHLDGIAAAESLRAIAPDCCVVMLTVHENPATRARAQEAGAVALVGKHASPEALLEAIRRCAGAR